MIDRPSRDQTIAAIEDFLDDKATAFEFNDRVQGIDTADETVNEVVREAWFYYDDCDDHRVVLTKWEWDFFQRMILLLRSNAEISIVKRKRWSWDHALAWLAVVSFLAIGDRVGWGIQLFALAIPFGLISLIISRYRSRNEAMPTAREIACMPFNSYSEIRWLRQQVPGFVKRRYRRDIAGRMIRTDAENWWNRGTSHVFWFLFAPVVLFFQGMPSVAGVTTKLGKPYPARDVTGNRCALLPVTHIRTLR